MNRKLENDNVLAFSSGQESALFGSALLSLAIKMHRDSMSHMVSNDNIHSFRHGSRWLTLRENEVEESSFKEVGVELTIEYEKILNNEMSHFFEFLEKFVEGFTSQTTQRLFQVISDSCQKVGNTVNRKEFSSDAETFLAMIEKVELFVSDDGQVHLPQIHLGEGMAEHFLKNLELHGEELKQKVDRIIEEKTKAAFEKDDRRKDKFKGGK